MATITRPQTITDAIEQLDVAARNPGNIFAFRDAVERYAAVTGTAIDASAERWQFSDSVSYRRQLDVNLRFAARHYDQTGELRPALDYVGYANFIETRPSPSV